MKFTIMSIATLAATAASVAIPKVKRGSAVSLTPHDEYSSAVGVLGCKIDINRVAYWPSSVSCDSLCVKVSRNGRSLNLLKVDTSGGAFDISYDAWNILMTGQSATVDPVSGGGIAATYEDVPMSECASLIHTPDGKLPLSAANSMDFYASCGAGSWIGQNSALYNIANPTCTAGVDEVCTLNLSVSNQPSCPNSVLGITTPLNEAVTNILYPSGQEVKAS